MSYGEEIVWKGFAILSGVVAGQEIDVLARRLANANLPRTRAGVRHAMRHPDIAALARSLQLLDIAKEILGGDAFPFRATLFDKSPKANWLVVWHQDTALPLRGRRELPGWGPWSVKDGITYAHAPAAALERVVALRVHLDDSTAKNGPLRVLPGTHRMGVLEDSAIRELAERTPPVTCEVPRGGVLAMRPLLVHTSSKSQSAEPRRVVHIEYAASPCLADGLELQVA